MSDYNETEYQEFEVTNLRTRSMNRVLWAVDAFEKPGLIMQSGKSVKALCQNSKAKIRPVYVQRPHQQFDSERGVFREETGASLNAAAEDKLQACYTKLDIPGLQPTHFLSTPSNSLRGAVKELLKYADETHADLIAIGTHGRRGAPRIFLGSFAETLVLMSPIPVFVINPKAHPIHHISHVFFPTDFTPGSKHVFRRVVELATDLDAKVLLFHQMEFNPGGAPYPFVIPPVMVPSFAETKRERSSLGEEWAAWASKRGVETRFELSTRPTDIGTAVSKAARKYGSGIIALASQSGALEAALMGSVTRQLIRTAVSPVLVLHPPKEEAAPRRTQDVPLAAAAYPRG